MDASGQFPEGTKIEVVGKQTLTAFLERDWSSPEDLKGELPQVVGQALARFVEVLMPVFKKGSVEAS